MMLIMYNSINKRKRGNPMRIKTLYTENTNALDEALENITNNFPCFVNRELIEMNYSEIEIEAREEDVANIERILASLV